MGGRGVCRWKGGCVSGKGGVLVERGCVSGKGGVWAEGGCVEEWGVYMEGGVRVEREEGRRKVCGWKE